MVSHPFGRERGKDWAPGLSLPLKDEYLNDQNRKEQEFESDDLIIFRTHFWREARENALTSSFSSHAVKHVLNVAYCFGLLV
jgi:hypothetical protein